ncbi:MAG: diguanylate cyclase [Marinilabiliales bacterium]|nr:MAG: diguanylate cyclase [Marinilabiliales bacterium]
MSKLAVNYLGLNLKNPIIAGSSGLNKNIENLIELEQKGVGAVVLKSLFEEQIKFEYMKQMSQYNDTYAYPEADDYIREYTEMNEMDKYIDFIREAKSKLSIPVIASINCISSSDWVEFATKIEDAGADALELNIFILPSDEKLDAKEIEERYRDIVDAVLKKTKLPLAIKLGYHFTDMARFMTQLSWGDVKGLVLFNRAFSPDIDIDNFKITAGNVFSSEAELSTSLRWVALLSDKVRCDISASTGAHSGEAIIKQILAGATTVQISSVLYKKGFGVVEEMVEFLNQYMDKHGFKTIEDFKGKMSFKESTNPAAYERVQFMKHFAGIE